MECIAPLAGEFLVAGAIASIGYALGKRKRENECQSASLERAEKALRTSAGAESFKLGQLSAQVQELTGKLASGQPALEGVKERVRDLEERLSSDETPESSQIVETFAARVSSLEMRARDDPTSRQLDELSAQVRYTHEHFEATAQALEDKAVAIGDLAQQTEDIKGHLANDTARVQVVECALGRLQQRLEAVEAEESEGKIRAAVDAEVKESQIEMVAKQVRELEGPLERFEGLSKRVDELEEQVEDKSKDLKRLTQTVASQVQAETETATEMKNIMTLVPELRTFQNQLNTLDKRVTHLDQHMVQVEEHLGRVQSRSRRREEHSELLERVERLSAEVDELKRNRRDQVNELQSSDGLVLTLQAKLSDFGDFVNHMNEKIKMLEMLYGFDMHEQTDALRMDPKFEQIEELATL